MTERPGPPPASESAGPGASTTPLEAPDETRATWTREDDELLLLDEIEDRPDDEIDDLV